MCEFNRPYPIPFGKHPDDYGSMPEIFVRPPAAWVKRAAELPENEQVVIENAVQEAAALKGDVHLYRALASPFLGISIEPGDGPNVKIWEH
jgi:hypothetical protein